MERLKDCMEELLKFTLSSHIDETLDFDLGISSKFCTNPLQDDPNDAVSPSTSNPHNTHFILHLFVSYLRARACMKVTLCYLFFIGST